MSKTMNCGEGRHEDCAGDGTERYPKFMPQLGDKFVCTCLCHAPQRANLKPLAEEIARCKGIMTDVRSSEVAVLLPNCTWADFRSALGQIKFSIKGMGPEAAVNAIMRELSQVVQSTSLSGGNLR